MPPTCWQALLPMATVTTATPGRRTVSGWRSQIGGLLTLSRSGRFDDFHHRSGRRESSPVCRFAGQQDRITFSPDGQYLAFTDERGLVAVDVESEESRIVATETHDETIWLDSSSLFVNDSSGINVVGLDGSRRLLVAATSGCGQDIAGWFDGKLYLINSCSHQGY